MPEEMWVKLRIVLAVAPGVHSLPTRQQSSRQDAGVQPLALPLLSWLGTSTVYAERRKDRFRQAARHG